MNVFFVFAAIAALLASSSAKPTLPNIVQLAESVPDLSILVQAVVAAGLADTLSTAELTVFAPTNEAFEALGPVLAQLLLPQNKAELVEILTYHVAAGQVLARQLRNGETIPTVEGSNVTAHITADGAFINGAQVIKADVLASNGVVHIINRVILPAPAPGNQTIVQIAQAVPDLSTLVTAVIAGDLVSVLSGPGPFTVFAPTNEAFAKLGPLVPQLLKPANKAELVKILTYHVVSGRAFSTDIFNGEAVPTVQGENVIVTVGAQGIFINKSQVIKADVDASNGVVHVIDTVLIPPTELEALLARVTL